jgi:hypothetical protein
MKHVEHVQQDKPSLLLFLATRTTVLNLRIYSEKKVWNEKHGQKAQKGKATE